MSAFGKNFGIESHVFGAKDATEMFPLLSPDSFKGAMYSPGIIIWSVLEFWFYPEFIVQVMALLIPRCSAIN